MRTTKGEFPDCGCHYTIDDDGIHFCAMHDAAPELLEALKAALPILDDAAQDTKALGPDFAQPAESLRLQAKAAHALAAKAEGK